MKVNKGDKLIYKGNMPYVLGCPHAVVLDKNKNKVIACCDVTVNEGLFDKENVVVKENKDGLEKKEDQKQENKQVQNPKSKKEKEDK